ncbi:hypothetical protein GCM10027280_21530 [Micromonospora polyrhachis]
MTEVSSPVLNEREVQSTYQPQALKPRVIESPRLAIELGGGPGSAAVGEALAGAAASAAAAVTAERRMGRRRRRRASGMVASGSR